MGGSPATLTALVIVSALAQLVISKWLFILRRIVTPTVGGTVLMILSITLASVVPRLLNDVRKPRPVGAPITALVTLGVIAALILRGRRRCGFGGRWSGWPWAAAWRRLSGFMTFRGIVTPRGRAAAGMAGAGGEFRAGLLDAAAGLSVLGIVISIQANGEAITQQRVAWRQERAVDFRQVQGRWRERG